MARDYSKQQTYYVVKVWFRHRTKTYTISTYDGLVEFLSKADDNETIIHYMVEAISKFIYPEYQSNKFRKRVD